MPGTVLDRAAAVSEWTTSLRRQLHRRPELSGEETETLRLIRDTLNGLNIDYVEVPDGGILGFVGREGASVLLRADIDALPITENSTNHSRERAVISENIGVMHACGHDAHTAMLLAAARILKEEEASLPGRVILLFERGEENLGLLCNLLAYIDEKKIRVDGAHAIHVRPGLLAGKIAAVPGPVFAQSCGFDVVIHGSGGHGSRPDLANSPLDCFTALYQSLKDIRLTRLSPFDPVTITVGKVRFGERGNVISDELFFTAGARTHSDAAANLFMDEFRLRIDGTVKAYRCGYEITRFFQGFGPVTNEAAITGVAQEAIRRHVGEKALVTELEPMMCSDDFATITRRWPSVMIHLGVDNVEVGSGADLHTALFDIDESVLPLGAAATAGFALDFLCAATGGQA